MKTIETIFKISGVLDGSLMAAINAASKAMSGLKGAGKVATAGALDMRNSLAAQLAALQRVQRQYDKYRVALEQLRPGLERVREATRRRDEVRLETRKAQESLEALKTKLTDLKRERDRSAKNSEQRRALDEQIRAGRIELKLQQGRAGEQERQLKAAQKALEDAAKNYNRTTNTVREMDAALKAAGESTSKIGLMSMALRGKMKEAQAQFERYNQAMTRLQSANDAHTQSASHFNNEWSNMSNAVSTAQSIMQPFKAAVDNAETFEHAMSKVKALTQSQNIKEGNYERVRQEMAELEAQARQLGATTQFTMTQAAEAQGYLGMAGWSKDQIIKAMPGMLDLAAASGMDLARTADIVSDNLTALGLDASQVGHMTDVYAYALTRSNLNMEALGESMKYAAPAMHAYGGDIHDAAAAMMIMGNAGIKGSMAGTALRMGLLRLAGPPKKASKEMEALGVSLSDATRMAYESQAQLEALGIHTDANMKPTEKMAYVLRELSTKMQGLSKDEKLAAVGAIFGVNAASGWLAVLEQGPEAFEDFRNALRTSDGTAKQVASTMNDDTRGAWLYLESAIDAVSNNVGSAFLPALKSIYEGLNPVVTSMAQWIGEHPGVVQGIGAIAASIAGGIVALSGFRLALAGINFVSTTVELMKATAAISALSSMTGGVVGVFGRLTAISSTFATGGIAAGFSAIGASLMGAAKSALAFIAAPWQALWGLLTGIAGQFGALLTIIQGQGLMAAIKTLGFAFQGAARSALAFLFSPWGMALAAIAALAAAAYMIYSNWEQVGGYFEGIGERIKAAFGEVGSALGPAFDQMSAAWSQFMASFNASGLGQVMLAGVLGAVEVITNVITTAIKLVGDLLSTIGKVGGKLMEAFSLLTSGNILGAIGKVREALGEGLMGVFDMVKHAVEGFAQALQNIGKIAVGFYDGTIMKGEFDWSALSWGAKPSEPKVGESVRQTVLETVKSDRSEREEIEVQLRNATREGNEEKTSELQTRLDNSEAITVASLTEALTELSAKEVKEAGGKDEFMSAVMSAVREQGTLNAEQQSSVISAVSEAIDTRLSTEGFTSELRAALSEKSTETLADRDALVQSMSQMISEQSNKDAALTAAIAEIKALDNVSDASKTDMIAQLTAAIEKLKSEEKKDDAPTKAMMPAAKSLESSSSALKSSADKLSALKSAAEGVKAAKEAQREGRLSTGEADPALAASILNAMQAVKMTDETAITRAMPMSMPSKGEAATPSGAAEINASTLELSTAISNAALEQSAASSQVTATMQQAALEQSAASAQVNASTMEMTAGLTQVNVTAQATGVELQNVGMNGQLASQGMQQVSDGSLQASASVIALAGSTDGAQAGMAAVAGASNSASGALGGLGSAASSAISALMSAASSAGSAVMNAAGEARAALSSLFSGGEPAHNAVGGIYPRGEFLTTFAEDSAEAAIPIKKGDSNAISLWQRTGAMLGVLGGQQPSMPMSMPSNGYISDEMARKIGQYSPEVRKSKSYESMRRAQEKTSGDFLDRQLSTSMMKPGGVFSRLPIANSALPSMPSMTMVNPSNIVSNEQTSESLSSKLQTYDQLEQQSMSLSTTTNNDQSLPPITLNFHFNGDVNREDVQRGVEESLPSIRETFEQQMMKYRHEVSRRSF